MLGLVVERTKVVHWENFSIMVGIVFLLGVALALTDLGVDALNTTLEVLIFSATMNFGQSWKTVAIQFACLWPLRE